MDLLSVEKTEAKPEWLENLSVYFSLKSKEKKKNRLVYTLQCLLCTDKRNKSLKGSQSSQESLQDSEDNENSKDSNESQKVKEVQPVLITGKDGFTFQRHLARCHKEENSNYVKKFQTVEINENEEDQSQMTLTDSSVVRGLKNSKQQSKLYPKKHPVQRQFEKYMLEFVVLDCVPFETLDREGFRRLIHHLNPMIRIGSRRTIVRSMHTSYDKVSEVMKAELRSMKPECLHIIIDIWSSRQHLSVLGVKVQFIKDWKINQLVIGFKHFPNTHTGINIRKTVEDLLAEYGIDINKVASITADNCSNMLSAFKLDGLDTTIVYKEPMLTSESEEEDSEEENNSTDDFGTVENSGNDDELDDLLQEEVATSDLDWVEFTTALRNPCLAHLLQLGIKDGFDSNDFVRNLIKKVNEIVNFFHKSDYWYTKLREKIKIALLKPCITRWNSQYHSLKRILSEKREKVSMVDNINSVLVEAKAYQSSKRSRNKTISQTQDRDVMEIVQTEECATKSKQSIPRCLTEGDVASLKIILAILEPFAQFTDELQADGVTSSIVILGLLNAVKNASEQFVDENELENIKDLENFQSFLCKSVVARFSTDKSRGETVLHPITGMERNIFSCDVLHTKNYVLASLLDPRIKTAPFIGILSEGTLLADKLPTVEEAIALLKCELQKQRPTSDLDSISNISSSSKNTSSNGSPPSKKKKSMFQLVEVPKEDFTRSSDFEEVDKYLKLNLCSETESPLNFWRRNEARLPILASIAKACLALPATSGTVERLFSSAGAIARSRRSRLTIGNIEKVLTVQQFLLNNSKTA